jgi:type IV pilus assembly protein PilO
MRTNTQVVVKKPSLFLKLYLLSPFVKLLMALLLFIAISLAGSYALYQQSQTEKNRIAAKRTQLETEVTREARTYGELVYLSKNVEEAKIEYQSLIKKFPPESKMGDLLANITKLGTAEGLKFNYFKPQPTINNGYYAAVPVDVSVVGKFHQLAQFLSDIANLPDSVVAVNQLTLDQADQAQGTLTLQFTATLYHTLPNSMDLKV